MHLILVASEGSIGTEKEQAKAAVMVGMFGFEMVKLTFPRFQLARVLIVL